MTNPTVVEQEFLNHKERLLGLAYRMLGRWSEAEDIVQEAFLRWSRSQGVEHPGAFLNKVVARLCLDYLKSAAHRREQYPGTWLPEPSGYHPGPEARLIERESLRFAFLRLLQELEPRERAAYLLREVLEAEYDQLSDWLGLSPANCRQLVSRARKRLKAERNRFAADQAHATALLERFMGYVLQGDREGLLELLQEDIVLWSDGGGKARSAVNPIYGADKVARFFLGLARKKGNQTVRPLNLNGVPAILTEEGSQQWVLLFDFGEDRLEQAYVVANPEKLGGLKEVCSAPEIEPL